MEPARPDRPEPPVTHRLTEDDYAEIFAAFAEPVRLKLVRELAAEELTVTELARRLGLSVGRTSHHLRILHQKGLVADHRDGRSIRYGLPSLSAQLEQHPGSAGWGGPSFEILAVLAALLTTVQARPAPLAGEETTLQLAAASDLTHVLGEIVPWIRRECGIQLQTTFGSTGHLASQIQAGVPIDLFAAARPEAIRTLTAAGLLRAEEQRIFARGRLVVWHRRDAPFMLGGLEDLPRPEVRWVAVADPTLAPHGAAAREALADRGMWELLGDRLVICENSHQALAFAMGRSAAAAIAPLALAPGSTGHAAIVPGASHRPLDQTVAITASTARAEDCKRVIAFLGGPLARPIFKKYGFLLPEEFSRAPHART